jgi:HK97 family phage major capsid protein
MSTDTRTPLELAAQRVNEAADALEEAAGAESPDKDLIEERKRVLDEAVAEAEEARAHQDRAEAIARARASFPPPERDAEPERGQGEVRVVREEQTYRREGRHSFFSDMYRAQFLGDVAAQERLSRHRQETAQQRDVGTGAFAGLTVPQYLLDLVAPLARAGRPLANSLRSLPLPDSGMVISISRITTGTAVAVQASENAAVQETDIDDTKLDVNVRTYAGQQDVSRQALERSEMVEDVVFADLVADYHTKLNSGIVNDDGTSGTHLGIRQTAGIETVTYTDASPTVSELYPKLADAIQRVNSLRFMAPTTIYMHPRRWGWLTAAVDSAGRPFVVPNPSGPFNAAGVGEAAGYGQVVGSIMGLPVITDASIPTNLGAGTNEDIIVVSRAPDLLLWEEGDGMPRQARFEQTLAGNLTVKLVVYGYSAFTAGRYPKATAIISGTGLVTPTF